MDLVDVSNLFVRLGEAERRADLLDRLVGAEARAASAEADAAHLEARLEETRTELRRCEARLAEARAEMGRLSARLAAAEDQLRLPPPRRLRWRAPGGA